MSDQNGIRVLRGAHVIDSSQGIDRVVDVAIENGKIRSIGEAPPGAEIIDVSGSYLSPGWIDIHVHVYGTLGFADPDSRMREAHLRRISNWTPPSWERHFSLVDPWLRRIAHTAAPVTEQRFAAFADASAPQRAMSAPAAPSP